ncbi:MAG: glycosyltransferase [Kosmotogaceae bacterium]
MDQMKVNKPIRVLMVIGSLGDGGKERQLLLLLRLLNNHPDIYTCLVVMNAGGERQNEAIGIVDKLIILEKRAKIDLIQPFFRLVKLIKSEKIDLIQTWGSGVWDLLGLLVGRIGRISVLHNGIRSAPSQLNIYNQITRISALYADAVVANSKAGLEAFDIADHPNSYVIYNGLDPSRFDEIKTEIKGQTLCMVANFRDEKDHKSVLLGMPDILKRFPNTKLILVGHDYGTLSNVEKVIDELKIAEHVRIITDCKKPEPIIGASQIGILATSSTYKGEGTSNALLEYMALSKPVIASKCGGNLEVILDKETGFLIPPGFPESISNKVIYLFENPQEAQKMGAKGKERVMERFSLERMEKDYVNLYKDMFE